MYRGTSGLRQGAQPEPIPVGATLRRLQVQQEPIVGLETDYLVLYYSVVLLFDSLEPLVKFYSTILA